MSSLDSPHRWGWVSIIAAVLLGTYLLIALYALLSPSNDPQRGMANGFIMFLVVLLVTLGALLGYGVVRNKAWLVRIVFGIAILPALSPIARLIYLLSHRS